MKKIAADRNYKILKASEPDTWVARAKNLLKLQASGAIGPGEFIIRSRILMRERKLMPKTTSGTESEWIRFMEEYYLPVSKSSAEIALLEAALKDLEGSWCEGCEEELAQEIKDVKLKIDKLEASSRFTFPESTEYPELYRELRNIPPATKEQWLIDKERGKERMRNKGNDYGGVRHTGSGGFVNLNPVGEMYL